MSRRALWNLAGRSPGVAPPRTPVPSAGGAVWYLLDLRRGGPAATVPTGFRIFTDQRSVMGRSEGSVAALLADGVRFNTPERDAVPVPRRPVFDKANPGRRYVEGVQDPVVRFSGRLVGQVYEERGRRMTADGYAVWASPEYDPPMDWSAYDTLELRVRGDGRRYVFVIECMAIFGPEMHQGYLFTEPGKWITARVPIRELYRVQDGRLMAQQMEPAQGQVISYAIMAEGQEGPFSVDVGWISLLQTPHSAAEDDSIYSDCIM